MQAAEAQGDVARMQAIAAKEQDARDAFYMPGGLLQNAYYHTIDRVFTSFPEIAFAGANVERMEQARQRALKAVQDATEALSNV
jgi:predicted RNase H-like nuclease